MIINAELNTFGSGCWNVALHDGSSHAEGHRSSIDARCHPVQGFSAGARLARPSGLVGGVQRQQVGLPALQAIAPLPADAYTGGIPLF